MKGVERRALIFSKRAHDAVGQKRKYNGEPYWKHPIAVAEIVKSVRHTPNMVAAAYLHDTVEDTDVTLEDINDEFGYEIAELVYWLTDVSRPEDGNRAARKAIDRSHIAKAPVEAKTIKVADIIDNSKDIGVHDPHFWISYRREMLLLLDVLRDGDDRLWRQAMDQCE